MSATGLWAAVAGGATVAGLLLLAVGLYGTTGPAGPSRLRHLLHTARGTARSAKRARTAAFAIVACAAVWAVTGWPVAGLAAGLAVPGLPYFFSAGRVAADRIAVLEALEQWVRRLSDSMAAGAAPVQTIVASAEHAPAPIAGAVARLAARLGSPRVERHAALRAFADEISDPLADVVVLALQITVTSPSARGPEVLRTLAGQVADEVAVRRRAENERAEPRSEARTIVIIQIVFVIAVCAATSYTAVYGTPVGQLVLALLAAVVVGALWMIRRLSLGHRPPRLLDPSDASPTRFGGVR